MKADSVQLVVPQVEIYTDGGCEPNPGPGGGNWIFPNNPHPACLTPHPSLRATLSHPMGEGNLPLPQAKELGAVLIHPKKRAEVTGGFRLTTNNRMEIFAAVAGLELLKQPCKFAASRGIAACVAYRQKVVSRHEHGSRNQRCH
jgi:ribonuclease HI